MTSPDYLASYRLDTSNPRTASYIPALAGARNLHVGAAFTSFFSSFAAADSRQRSMQSVRLSQRRRPVERTPGGSGLVDEAETRTFSVQPAVLQPHNTHQASQHYADEVTGTGRITYGVRSKPLGTTVIPPATRNVPDQRLKAKMDKWRAGIEKDTTHAHEYRNEKYGRHSPAQDERSDEYWLSSLNPSTQTLHRTLESTETPNRPELFQACKPHSGHIDHLPAYPTRAAQRQEGRRRYQVPLRDLFDYGQSAHQLQPYHSPDDESVAYHIRVPRSAFHSELTAARKGPLIAYTSDDEITSIDDVPSGAYIARAIASTNSDTDASDDFEKLASLGPSQLPTEADRQNIKIPTLTLSQASSSTQPSDRARVRVADSGSGIGPPVLPSSEARTPARLSVPDTGLPPGSPASLNTALSDHSSVSSVSTTDYDAARQQLHSILSGSSKATPSASSRKLARKEPAASPAETAKPVLTSQDANGIASSSNKESLPASSEQNLQKRSTTSPPKSTTGTSSSSSKTSESSGARQSAFSDPDPVNAIAREIQEVREKRKADNRISQKYRPTPLPSPSETPDGSPETSDAATIRVEPVKSGKRPARPTEGKKKGRKEKILQSTSAAVPTITVEEASPEEPEISKPKKALADKGAKSSQSFRKPRPPRQVHFASSPTWVSEDDSPLHQPIRGPFRLQNPRTVSTGKVPKLPTPFSSPTATTSSSSASSSEPSYSDSESGLGTNDEQMFRTPKSPATKPPGPSRTTGFDMPVITDGDSSDDETAARTARSASSMPTPPSLAHQQSAKSGTPQSQPTHQSAAPSHVTTLGSQRRRHEPGSSGLDLPAIPEVSQRKNNHLPGPALAYTLKACKGTSVYKRLRTLVWDFHSDLEDMNKKRERYWMILIERLESMIEDMIYTLENLQFKDSLPLYTKALGNEKEGLAAWTIMTQNQIFEMTEWTEQAAKQTWEIIRSSTEMLNQNVQAVPVNTGRAFLSINQGFQAMYVYFVRLEKELREIAAAVGTMFHQYLVQVPSKTEFDEMGPERQLQMEVMGDDIAHWLSRIQIEVRKWKKKIDYWHFEKQLTPLRNLDREWQEEIDSSSMALLRSLLCFGWCLPRDLRTTVRGGHLKGNSAPTTPAQTPRVKTDQNSAYPPAQAMSRDMHR